MKNILIITTFEDDTLQSLKIATDLAGNNASDFVLLSCSEVSDSITDLLFLPKPDVDPQKKWKLIRDFQQIRNDQNSKANLLEHHQYGMSRPILDQILSRYKIDLAIVPISVQQSKQHIHQLALKLLHKTSCPLMFLPETTGCPDTIKRALYLNDPGLGLTTTVENLPFHIIHQSMLEETNEYSLAEMISELRIDLVVKGKRNREATQENEDQISELGVPVLTV